MDLDANFSRYDRFDPAAPVWCVTPDIDRCFHRFFDTSPISPSRQYLGLTRLPAEDRPMEAGEPAEIVIVDLETGDADIVAETHGWDTQLGAQVQWGASDEELFFIDMDVQHYKPYAVRMNPLSGETTEIDGELYMVSPDGSVLASPCLRRTRITQWGYGVIVADEEIPKNSGAADDDGLYLTDVTTGDSRLLLSYQRIFDELLDPDKYADGDFYGAHVKWNLQGTRLMLVVRWMPHDGTGMLKMVVTVRPDGTELACAIPDDVWARGGHHPNWTPDGERVMMNLKLDGENMRLASARWDGSDLRTMNDDILGTGHPSLHTDGRHVITDEYAHASLANDDGTTPLRLLDIATGEEVRVARIRSRPDYEGEKKELRVDPHPAWGPEFRYVTFNACPDGGRDVFIADIEPLL